MKQEECSIPIHRPKTTEMLFFLTCGIIMSIPITLFIRSFVDPLLTNLTQFTAILISYTFFAPFIEEFSKILPLYYRHGETQRSILNLAIMVGLGFAIVELLEYVFILGVPVIFRLSGLVFHSSSTAIAAYGIATHRPVPFYLLAVALHFSYNFLVLVNPFPFTPAYIIVGIAASLAYMFYGRTREKVIQYL
jgi:RsiW-degrading membrane proteinase PrsW (M82 family)